MTERAAKALSDTVTPAGLVAVCEMPATRLTDVLTGSPRLVAVAVEIGEPGNAGTVIRIADAMGAAAVILGGHSVDPYNGKCLRASAGSIFSIPVVVAPDARAAVGACVPPGCRCWPPRWTARRRWRTPTCAQADGLAVRPRITWPVTRDRRRCGPSGAHPDVRWNSAKAIKSGAKKPRGEKGNC